MFAVDLNEGWETIPGTSELTTKLLSGETLHAPAYVIRPSGTPHGPLISATRRLLLAIRYFAEREAGPTKFLDAKAPR